MGVYDRNDSRRIVDVSAVSSLATRVYSWMSVGLLCTAFVALAVVRAGIHTKLLPYLFLMGLATLGIALTINAMVNKLSFPGMAGLFLLYSGIQGLFFGAVLPIYAAHFGGEVIWTTFLTAGTLFGVAVLYGIFTKADLTRLTKILQLALFGLIALTLVYAIASLFLPITGGMLIISYFGLILFVGLTAFDAQAIRRVSQEVHGDSIAARKLSLMLALKMYINVIMIFWYLLQILSSNRR